MDKKFHQAALTYAGIGILVVLLTLLFAVPARKASLLLYLAPGIFFVLIFALLIYKNFRKLTMALCFLAGLRTVLFMLNFFGIHVEYPFLGFRVHVLMTQPFRPIFLINSLLMVLIAYMLARAAWDL